MFELSTIVNGQVSREIQEMRAVIGELELIESKRIKFALHGQAPHA